MDFVEPTAAMPIFDMCVLSIRRLRRMIMNECDKYITPTEGFDDCLVEGVFIGEFVVGRTPTTEALAYEFDCIVHLMERTYDCKMTAIIPSEAGEQWLHSPVHAVTTLASRSHIYALPLLTHALSTHTAFAIHAVHPHIEQYVFDSVRRICTRDDAWALMVGQLIEYALICRTDWMDLHNWLYLIMPSIVHHPYIQALARKYLHCSQ